ncbi:phage tail termination protein [Nocardia pulmonis]
MLDLFGPMATTLTSLPATGDQFTAKLPFLWVRTLGGTLDGNEITYIAKVRVVAVARTRTEAQQLAGRAREAMLNTPATRVNGVLIDWAEETVAAEVKYFPPTVQRSQGVADLPNLDPLEQMVEIGFTLHARRQ